MIIRKQSNLIKVIGVMRTITIATIAKVLVLGTAYIFCKILPQGLISKLQAQD
jgi:predicted membrane chloride channel (bestrophin family)